MGRQRCSPSCGQTQGRCQAELAASSLYRPSSQPGLPSYKAGTSSISYLPGGTLNMSEIMSAQLSPPPAASKHTSNFTA